MPGWTVPVLLTRVLRRGLEAAHVVGLCAADGHSRKRLFEAYGALAKRNWSPIPVDARLRMGRSVFALRFRQEDIYVIGEILHDRLYRIRSRLPAMPVIVDAGANIGVSALWLAAHFPNARLHCFEPEAANFTLLEHNLRQLSHAKCERVALAAHSGNISLYVTQQGAAHSVFDTGVASRAQVVPCLALGEYLERNQLERVDLLKIDVEGSELAVLQGLGQHIERVRVIVGEFHRRLVDEAAFYDLLQHRGFRVIARWPAHHGRDQHMFEVAR